MLAAVAEEADSLRHTLVVLEARVVAVMAELAPAIITLPPQLQIQVQAVEAAQMMQAPQMEVLVL